MFHVGPIVSLTFIRPREVIADKSVPLLDVGYEDIIPERVHGVLEVTLSTTTDLSNKQVVICAITDGQVIQEEARIFVQCKKPLIAPIIDNFVSVQLLSGEYFFDLEDTSILKAESLPVRVSIHKGKRSEATIAF